MYVQKQFLIKKFSSFYVTTIKFYCVTSNMKGTTYDVNTESTQGYIISLFVYFKYYWQYK